MATETKIFPSLNLKHRTIIIGVMQSIGAFMFLVLSAAYAENPHELITMSDPSIVPDVKVLRIILITIATGSAFQCVFSILLIFAAETNRPVLVIPWLILNPAAVLLYVLGTLIAIIHYSGDNVVPFIIGHILFALIVTLIVGLKVHCVWKFYKHLRSLNF
ncbi:unnamed protein product [Acanthoscelides obtectus]|uniref:Uncharacterized protein n=1 Tax=Acanthoscelides obtectus TaxID=200917 RepID=A0A9P0PZB4_ACAOB|nr:unnamed protein product [Acanthoscelides obtectus]CAH2004635.1 unnamed protein product [Acanthoscelides obtectus]CAK1646232.1 hypothetical protein AOBTE_LOCUS14521 [Acanthoscelides obtectus]CAK1646234.1 hypothetical protein AOBTE_LOCUS14521 [Acanthoscelides obtectus]